MRVRLALSVALALFATSPALAVAQDVDDEFADDESSDDGDADGDEMDMTPDDLGDVDDPFPNGQPQENEEDPIRARLAADVEADQQEKQAAPADPMTREGYPLELVARPIILPATMAEARYEGRYAPSPLLLGGVLKLSYGVTNEVQLGLSYGTGTLGDASGDTRYEIGRALAVEGVYLFNKYVGLQVELPFYVDPFALAVTLGPRFEIQLGDDFRFVTGEDLVTVRLVDFYPTLRDEQRNQEQARRTALNINRSSGLLRFPATLIYQRSPNLSFAGDLAVEFDEFDSSNAALALEGRVNYAFSNKFDVGARIGFLDMKDAVDTFGISAFIALRL